MDKKYIYIFIFLFSVFISSVSQIGLKKASERQYKNIFFEYCNFLVIFSYSLFAISMLITIFALRVIPLSFAPVIESAGYVFVTLLSKVFLKEKITTKKIAGMIVIVTGIVIYSI